MIKKSLTPIIIVALLLFTGFSVIAIPNEDDNSVITVENDQYSFSPIKITSHNEKYVTIKIDGIDTYLMVSGKPMLPVYRKTFVYPFGTKILDVNCDIVGVVEENIKQKITPAPDAIPISSVTNSKISNIQNSATLDENVYNNAEFYPDTWYKYSVTCGLDTNGSHVVYLILDFYPVRYSPKTNMIKRVQSVGIHVKYEKPSFSMLSNSEYDMVIITPNVFKNTLTPLVNHKNRCGIRTVVKTVESICRPVSLGGYPGRDKPEKIKYFIKDALETWGVKYVLLVGGRNGQLNKWYVPVRYSHLDDQGDWETSFLSDLYYADIYRYNVSSNSYEFDDWDSNGNSVFAEWTLDAFDDLDLVPDVYLGRLPCRNKDEVRTMVQKIINYETMTYGENWFKNMILVGGDTVPTDDDYYEGEIETAYGASFMKPLGFKTKELWVSNGNLTEEKLTGDPNLTDAINEGAGFLFLSGHGNPMVWSTHPLHNDTPWMGSLYIWNMNKLSNMEKLPVCIVGGCHNSQFDVTVLNFIKGFLKERLKFFVKDVSVDTGGMWKYEWMPRCWSWNLVRQEYGGSIATIGNTGLGWGSGGSSCIESLDGWITTHFFQVYSLFSQQDKPYLGNVHGQTVTDYVNTFKNDWSRLDSKTVEGWVLLGDPTLKIGGYPSS